MGLKVVLVCVWSSSTPQGIVCGMLEPATDFCFKGYEVIWLTPLGILESPFIFLHDCDVAVTTACFVADVAAALAVLQVITLSDATLVVVNLWDEDRTIFLED